jgi:hypothetical protein
MFLTETERGYVFRVRMHCPRRSIPESELYQRKTKAGHSGRGIRVRTFQVTAFSPKDGGIVYMYALWQYFCFGQLSFSRETSCKRIFKQTKGFQTAFATLGTKSIIVCVPPIIRTDLC